MSDKSKIEWTDSTWNPVSGCTKASPGCAHCYAERLAKRLPVVHAEGKSFSTVLTHPERLAIPLHWRRPRRVFVCSMGDLFHEDVPFQFIAAVFGVAALRPRHTFQILSKRPGRMESWFKWAGADPGRRIGDALCDVMHIDEDAACAASNWIGGWSRWRDMPDDGNPLNGTVQRWPLSNVWLGVTAEDQQRADERIPLLLQCQAAVRLVSCEPLLSAIDLTRWINSSWPSSMGCRPVVYCPKRNEFDWVIAGGETGPGARPMHPAWARSLRDQCEAAGVPFFFKSWGEWLPDDQTDPATFVIKPGHPGAPPGMIGAQVTHLSPGLHAFRCGKRAAGRLLDGVTHDECPEDR